MLDLVWCKSRYLLNTIEEARDYITEITEQLAQWQAFDAMEMYGEIIALGKNSDTLPPDEVSDELRVKGCASEVYIEVSKRSDKLFLRTRANSQIVRGIVSILKNAFDGLPANDFLNHADELVSLLLKKIDIQKTLTPTRTNSIGTILAMIKSGLKN